MSKVVEVRDEEGYCLPREDYDKLWQLQAELHYGTDRERDYGHRLWIVLAKVRDLPIYNLAKL